jgi:hypothetical protein
MIDSVIFIHFQHDVIHITYALILANCRPSKSKRYKNCYTIHTKVNSKEQPISGLQFDRDHDYYDDHDQYRRYHGPTNELPLKINDQLIFN